MMSGFTGPRARIATLAREWGLVVAIAILGLLAVSKVGEDVFAGESTAFDSAVQGWMLGHQTPLLFTVFLWVTRVGGVGPMLAVSLGAVLFLRQRNHRHVAAIVMLAPLLAVGVFLTVKTIYARPRPAGLGGVVPSSYSFPSGHATASAAICCTLAYVFWREGFVRRPLALLFAVLVPLGIGLSRLYLNVHWATDVLGGWSVGVLVAVLSVVLYERQKQRAAVVEAGQVPPSHLKDP